MISLYDNAITENQARKKQVKNGSGHKFGIMFSDSAPNINFESEKMLGVTHPYSDAYPQHLFLKPLFSKYGIQAIHYFPANTLYTYLIPVNVLSLILYVKYT